MGVVKLNGKEAIYGPSFASPFSLADDHSICDKKYIGATIAKVAQAALDRHTVQANGPLPLVISPNHPKKRTDCIACCLAFQLLLID